MMFIEIKEDKFDKAYEHLEQMLKHGGKLMSCFAEWDEERDSHQGGSMGYRSGMGYRNDNGRDWMPEDEMMGERKRRSRTGRYY